MSEITGIEDSGSWHVTFTNDPTQPNNLNIDLFGLYELFFLDDDPFTMSCLLGINGERFRTLPTKITFKSEDGTETYIYRYTMKGEYISKVEQYQEQKGKQKLIGKFEIFYEE